jgi:hypothetical protein
MATTSHTALPEVSAPEAPGPHKARGRFATRGALTWAAVLAAFVAAVALAVVTLTGGDDTNPVTGAHSGLAEHGSIRSIEGSVEDNVADRLTPGAHSGLAEHRDASAPCVWTSDVNNTPVFPRADLGGPPTPGSVLIFEKCDGDWTGNMAWFQR